MFDETILRRLKSWKESPLRFAQECMHFNPSDQQAEALHIFPKTRRLSIRSGHGCHAKGTVIHMFPYGFKLVEDVEIGDTLMGDDNTPREVLELYSGKEMMYRIKYHDGTYYDVNESHKLALVCTGSKGKYKTGQKIEISVRDFLALPPSYYNRFAGYKVSVDYPDFPVIIPPYILGMWLGDGSHNKLELTNIDRKLIGIWELFGKSNGLKMTTDPNEKLHRLVGDNDNTVHNAFEHYNLFGNKHIPKEYLFNSKEVRLKLLAGLIDTDGYADSRGNSLQFQIIQKRKELAEDILFLAQSCGMHATLTEKVKSWTWGKEKKYDVYYEVRISRNAEIIPTQLERKQEQNKFSSKQRNNLHFGFSIEKLSKETYYGFEVNKNHLYVLGDFTVTRNTGKDALAGGVLIPWFMVTRTFAKVVCVAPTARQLSDILWSEISKWLRQSLVADEFIIQRDKIFQKDSPREWWCRAISPSAKASPEEQVESVAGIHGDHLLWVLDEASGIVDPVFIPIEGSCTQEDNSILMIGNMTKNQGYFYDSHFHTELKKVWTQLHWDSRKSTNVKQSYCEYMETKYGVDSNIFRIRVEGNPPLGNDDTLIPLAWAEQCVGNEITVAEDEPLYDGVDVARFGDDDSIILPREGNIILPWETHHGMQTIDLAMRVRLHAIENDAQGVAVDEIGVGAGVVDWLAKHNTQNLFGVNVSSASSDITKADRLRDQLWIAVRDKCMRMQYSFPTVKAYGDVLSQGQILANGLASLRYSFNAHGGYKVESKKDAKKRGIKSPNEADALCLTEYFNAQATQLFKKAKPKTSQDRWKHYNQQYGNANSRHAWQTV